MLTFDEQTHTYYLNGQKVPGVTSVLSPLTDFSRVPPHVLQAASDFGKAVHRACELHDLGELDHNTLDPALWSYLDAWIAFSADHSVEWEQIEQPAYNATMRYAGTPDRFGKVNGRPTVVDIKSTAQLYPAVGPQLAAYANALQQPYADRLAVQLKGDGTYVAKPYTDPADWPLFCSLLTLRNWCARHSITPKF
ncbi:hypothetical protein [Quisquiliibacterium transsilvanicum]|uniref:PD-(D/E)XK endonuclease-like domain-containing protein n=1 Tax=Quisquiliibacterium transsilvanicum TaxID=1549638 RepID=A0A7W8HGJ1_9BURK|nr:hypothetical protein [Quisquiliibacterium transsilvanicum]MBB5271518.1 hypothetical protein [Quisquiliibacterium transsilvanicum]